MALSYSYNSATNSYSVVSNSCTAGAVVIPDTYNDGVNGVKPVKSIGASAFAYCYDITSIFIPNSVTTIENGTFAFCPFLSVVTIGNSVTSIGPGAFLGCIALTSIVIPNSVTSIGNAAFMNTGLTSIIIPNGITSLSSLIFRNCQNLTSITIPESVTSIGEAAFSNCSSLTNITIPKNVISIGDYVFDTINLETIIFLGDAPQFGSNPFEFVNVNCKIYRIGGTKGWGIENTFQGKPISYYYKNLIKGDGGTGKLTTKKRN